MEKSSAPKPWLISANVVIQIVLVTAIFVIANLGIYYWHPKRVDLTQAGYFKLSDKTRQLLASLKKPVEIIVFFQPNAQEPVTQQVYQYIQGLLKAYDDEAPRQKGVSMLKVRYVDPDRDPVSAERLSSQYNVKVPNVVVFVYEDRSKYVQVGDLVEFARPSGPFGGGSDRIRAFRGEQQFSSALQNVCEAKQPKVYFLQGHGEGDPDEFEARKGFSNIATYVRRDNLVVEKLNLVEKQQIPSDCDVLVVCGPNRSFSELDLKVLQDYLSQNGRAMFLLDALQNDTGLERLLRDFGVQIGNNAILTQTRDLLGRSALVLSAPCSEYGNHPITQGLKDQSVSSLFPAARSVEKVPGESAHKQQVTVLVETSKSSWGETDLANLRQDKAQFDEKDRKGPVPVAVAVEPAAAGEMEREGMRMVVFGSSGFIRNGSLSGGNVDLFLNAMNWLLKRQQLIGIASKTPQEFSLNLDPSQRKGIMITEVFLIPFGVAVLGFFVWLNRRK